MNELGNRTGMRLGRRATHLASGASGLALGLALSWATASSGTLAQSKAADAQLAPVRSGLHFDEGGAEQPFTVRVKPNKDGNQEVADYDVEVQNVEDAELAISSSYTIVRDTGETVSSGETAPAKKYKPKSLEKPKKLAAPKNLADGFYAIRVTSAGAGRGVESVQVQEEYVSVQGGKVRSLSADEWFAQSKASQGRIVPSDKQPTSVEEARALYGEKK